jgi:transposase
MSCPPTNAITSKKKEAAMFLKMATNKNTGRTYMSICRGYRDKERGHSRTVTVQKLGYLDELEKEYDDPIAHFRVVCDKMNTEAEAEDAEYTVKLRKGQKLQRNTCTRRNFGYIVPMKIFYELGIERFLLNRQRKKKIEHNTAQVMKLLVLSRLLYPASKQKTYLEKGRYFDFEKDDSFSLIDVYRDLSHFSKLSEDLQKFLHERIVKQYGRGLDLVYYDVTNYYFEIDKEDSVRQKGYSKEHRPDPIVNMGLAMDKDGIPIAYEMFPGAESEKLHLRPMSRFLWEKLGTGKVIYVADKAHNTGDNINYIQSGNHGYVFSQTIAGGTDNLKEWVFDDKGYVSLYEDEEKQVLKYKRKSAHIDRIIDTSAVRDGKQIKRKVQIEQKLVAFYSDKYAQRQKAKREIVIQKAYRIMQNPTAYTRAASYGALKYLKNIEVDKKTGEIKEPKVKPVFDFEKLKEEEKYDGYYALVTNQLSMSDDKIIDTYRGLWKIEDCFKVTKSELEARPIYVSREDRINAHFLTCFIALIIIRLIQKRLAGEFSVGEILEALRNIACSKENENSYLFDFRTELTDAIGDVFGLDFTNERLTRGEIKKYLAMVKKD